MALQGPAYGMLVRDRTAAVEDMKSLQLEATVNSATWTVIQFGVHLEVLESYWQGFRQAQRQLRMEFPHIEMLMDTMQPAEREALDVYATTKATLQQLKVQLEAIAPQVKPPRPSEIKVSTFSGKYTEWSAWRAEFQAKVYDTRLSPADKITLLLGALTKEAAKCAGQAERLDEVELDRIWSKLDRTYDNKYQQVYQHIAQITHISPLLQPSADKLRAMIDTVDEHLRMLKRFDIETDHWGPIVCVLLLDKLDVETRNQWESKDTLPSMPELPALLAYLEQRILAIRNVEQSARRAQPTSTNSSGSATKPIRTGMTGAKQRYHPYEGQSKASPSSGKDGERLEPPNCPQCGNNVKHNLWHCDAFRALASAAQLQQLSKWGVCEVCLRAKHKAADCTKGACPVCKTGRHNSLVCPQARTAKQVNHVRRKRMRDNPKNEAE